MNDTNRPHLMFSDKCVMAMDVDGRKRMTSVDGCVHDTNNVISPHKTSID